jgi:hypothetical protein
LPKSAQKYAFPTAPKRKTPLADLFENLLAFVRHFTERCIVILLSEKIGFRIKITQNRLKHHKFILNAPIFCQV